jgi:hypothetical protein
METAGEPIIYQLRVILEGISPLIWRRLIVPGDYSIADLHFIVSARRSKTLQFHCKNLLCFLFLV